MGAIAFAERESIEMNELIDGARDFDPKLPNHFARSRFRTSCGISIEPHADDRR